MSNFLFLFRADQSARTALSPAQMQETMKKWMNWLDALEKSGNLKARGERLDGSGKLVRGKSKTVVDGPYAEVKDTIGGYMIVQAGNLDHAVEISKGCPIFEIDGAVEVRPIVSM